MNALVRRYSVGRSTSERLRLLALWESLVSKARKQSRSDPSPMVSYGRVALAFIAEMKKQGWARVPSVVEPDKSRERERINVTRQ